MRSAAIALLPVAVLMAAPASAYELQRCRPPAGVSEFLKLSDAPGEIRQSLKKRAGDIVNPGEPFDATDVVTHGAHFWRLVFIWHRGSRWVVATEHGGIAYGNPIFAFDLREDGQPIETEFDAIPRTLDPAAAG